MRAMAALVRARSAGPGRRFRPSADATALSASSLAWLSAQPWWSIKVTGDGDKGLASSSPLTFSSSSSSNNL
jgi:hypothetical protein